MRRTALLDDRFPWAITPQAIQLAYDRAITDHQLDALAFDLQSARSFDDYGRMHVQKCRISKANVCPYYGREIPNFKELGLDPNKIYRLYRDPKELEKAAPTFRNLPLLRIHTKVTAKDAKAALTVGTVGNVSFDGDYLVADHLTVWDHDGIQLIESEEAKELSSSYGFRVEMTPGVSPQGVAFDGSMRDIKGNHVALVHKGRAGRDVVVNDDLPLELRKMKRKNLIARLVALQCLAAGTYEKEQLVALDEELAKLTAQDAAPMEDDEDDEDEEGDPEHPTGKGKGKGKGKLNPGKGKPTEPGGALASDEEFQVALDAAIKAKGYMSKAEVQALVESATQNAATSAMAKVNALHIARETVKPLVGVVAMDSAEAVYKFALEQEKVALDGVPPEAYPALVRERIAAKAHRAAPAKGSSIPADAASAAAASLPGLGFIQVAG